MKRIVYHFLWLSSALILFSCNGPQGRVDDDIKTIFSKNRISKGKAIYVDFSIPSGEKRLFIIDLDKQEVIYAGLVQHGCGGNSTAEKPEFSNRIGSKCSSLGLYRLGEISRMTKYPLDCIRLDGLSPTNSNARVRGIVIHPSVTLSLTPFPLKGVSLPLTPESEGCFAVSLKTFNTIKKLREKTVSPIYLYANYEE
ncbi:MAG: murein L,D-transpeptidase catalytic domain-containing protein [Alloprevotella sp.]